MRLFLAALVLCCAMPAIAQTAEPAASINPNQLARGRKLASLVLPPNVLESVLSDMAQKILWPVIDKVTPPAAREIATMTGLDEADLGAISTVKLDEAMDVVDPAFYQRQGLMNSTLQQGKLTIIKKLEPDVREEMAQAFAKERSVYEMDVIIAYFETWAATDAESRQVLVTSNPLFLAIIHKTLPKIIEAIPSILKKTYAAAANIPKARKIEDLKAVERTRFFTLIGVSPDTLGRKSKP